MFSKKSNYSRSKSIDFVDINVSQESQRLVCKLLEVQDEKSRQSISDCLLDELADCAQIDIVKLKISSTRQYHRKHDGRVVMKRYGYYRPKSKYIYIQNRTAVRGQILASKTFIDTLLHEWMHHYDYCKLNLDSIHTSGFFARLSDLKSKLGL